MKIKALEYVSEPGAVATGSRYNLNKSFPRLDPVATAPGSDTVAVGTPFRR